MPAKIRAPTLDALSRERLELMLATIWSHRLGLVVAPPGSGKTTLLATFAARCGVPVAWYRAETWDGDETTFVRHLQAALGRVMPGLGGSWHLVEDAVAALEAWEGGQLLLVIDDFYTLEGTPAESALGRLVDYAPRCLAILIGSRMTPDFNLSRLRVSGELLEIGADDLRFRTWEVERLFRDHYGERFSPSDVAVLARRTEGWAAGLQLFHLATRGKTPDERRRILSVAAASGRLVREYLARNVLAELPAELRTFLVETCVLGRLTGDLCDRLRGRTGSVRLLEELTRRQVFTVTLDPEEGSYRYHEVLRAHLDRVLVDEFGEAEARTRYARAGGLLEAEGGVTEALAAYCRAEDWAAVGRLLGREGERLANGAGGWLQVLPAAISRHDPWLTLASARQARADGRWIAALDAYVRSETAFGATPTAGVARDERMALAAWLEPVTVASGDWIGVLRGGLAREPLAAAREVSRLPNGPIAFARGILMLAAGMVVEAGRFLEGATDDKELGPALMAGAWIAGGIATALAGDLLGLRRIDDGAEAAERAGYTWLAERGRVAFQLLGGRVSRCVRSRHDHRPPAGDPDDRWGNALDQLFEAWSPAGPGTADDATVDPDDRLRAAEAAAASFRALGAGVLESWARSLAAIALAESGMTDAREAAFAAESLARTTGAPGARLLAYAALARMDPARCDEFELLVSALHEETGLQPPAIPDHSSPMSDRGPNHSIDVRTFGGFSIAVDGRRLGLEHVRPRARAVLRFLAIHGGNAVHREVIGDALWPEADARTGGRSLHVAISSLRGLFVEHMGHDGGRLIAREGDAYRFVVEDEAVDLRRFERAIAEGRAARARGDRSGGPYGRALELHRGDLLPEDGPADWVLEWRDRSRTQAVEAARALAEEELLDGELDRATAACRAGLELDRYDDPLWRMLIQARDRAGDRGAASHHRREYAAILADLGVSESSAASLA